MINYFTYLWGLMQCPSWESMLESSYCKTNIKEAINCFQLEYLCEHDKKELLQLAWWDAAFTWPDSQLILDIATYLDDEICCTDPLN